MLWVTSDATGSILKQKSTGHPRSAWTPENIERVEELWKPVLGGRPDALSAALDDLAQGRSLLETANTHHIPRSTLYARARSYGITPTITRQEHSEEKITAAVETVKAGASLQTASAMYSIPKTVLWRRVQKDIGCYALSRRAKLRQRYHPHAKEAAVRALENGEKINKVASQYKRVQLREEPILPVTFERPTRTERRCQTCSPL
ncbi:hypothetical protein J6590_004915 [Homalodisca vitripennis]|nr:hypothetical protein J6590_004915 [Homalodisca vitripennis]